MEIETPQPVRMGIYFPPDFIAEFRAGCKKRGYKQSALIRIAVTDKYLKLWREEDAQRETA